MEFRLWKALSKANINTLELLCEIVALASSDEDDQEFEDVDEEEESKQTTSIAADDELSQANVVDIDDIKGLCSSLIFEQELFNQILSRCQSVPQFLGLPRDMESVLNDV